MNHMNTQEGLWIGLDVDSAKVFAAIAPLKIHEEFTIDSSGMEKLAAWALKTGVPAKQIHILMESTGIYSHRVQSFLAAFAPDFQVSILNPKFLKSYLESRSPRRKTDYDDAEGISWYGYERHPEPTPLLSELDMELRALVRVRTLLVEQRVALENHMASTIDGYHDKVLGKMVSELNKGVEKLEKKMEKLIKSSEEKQADYKKLTEIFGVAKTVATVILAELGDLRRFKTAKQLACYCGMTPRILQSGKSKGKSRLSKVGSPAVRRALYLAALSHIRYAKTDLNDVYTELVSRGMNKRNAMIRVMRKILDRMHLIITTDTSYERYPKKSSQVCE